MLKRFCLTATLLLVAAVSMQAAAQDPKPSISGNQIETSWRDGLSASDQKAVERVAAGRSDQDRFMIYTAVVRSGEAARTYLPGERLDNMKVLANIRVRMSNDESNMWLATWNRLSNRHRTALLKVFRNQIKS